MIAEGYGSQRKWASVTIFSAAVLTGWLYSDRFSRHPAKAIPHLLKGTSAIAVADFGQVNSAPPPPNNDSVAAVTASTAPTQQPTAAPVGSVDPVDAEHEARGQILAATEKLYQDTQATEAIDQSWAQTADRTITDLYSGDDFSALQIKADCRSTICRVDFQYTDPVNGKLAFKKFLRTQPWPGKRMTHVEDDKQAGVSYFAREGSAFPVLPSDTATQ